ncbi:MAG: flagellar basal body P-ring formation protein FlgA [Fibrobacteres bacterium]|nr:flagellar basal body P-ring formation protein FlgA [Fibrobacterota bacterium]
MKILFLLIISVASLFSAEIILRESASVKNRNITVGDIAVNSIELSDAVANLVVSKAAPSGYTVLVGRPQVSAILNKHGFNAKLSGAERVKVKTGARIIPPQVLTDIARKKVIESMPWKLEQIRLDINRMPDTLMVSDGEVSITAELPQNCDYRNSQIVELVVAEPGNIIRRFPLAVRIRIFEDVYVAKTKVARHELFSDDNIRIERREITEVKGAFFGANDTISGRIADKTILAGKIITDDYLMEPLLVRKGENVKIVSTINDAVVSVDGEALRDGALGVKVPVRNMLTGKRVTAYVVGESAVSMQRPKGGLL